MRKRATALAAMIATALLSVRPTPATALTDDDVRGGWIADVNGQRHIYVLKVRGGQISGIHCWDCSSPEHLAFIQDGKVGPDGIAFRLLHDVGQGVPYYEEVRGKLENGLLILTSTVKGARNARPAQMTLTREPRRTRPGLSWPADQLAAAKRAGGPSAGATAAPPPPPPPPPAAPAAGRGRGPYVPPGPNEPFTAARISGLWLTGAGPNSQHVMFRQVGDQILGQICGPCDNPFTVWPIDNGVIMGDMLTFHIVHEDTAFPGTTFVAPFNTLATATLSRTEMHLRLLRQDNGTWSEMTLIGPIRLDPTR
jgi:hypothetical protein